MSELWSPFVRALTPYVPGEQPTQSDVIKLNTNENPYGPSPRALDAIRAASTDDLRLYPDPGALALKSTLARLHSLAASQVFVGNGSDEVLAHSFHALLNHDDPILFPDVTYSFYPVYCNLYGIEYAALPLTPEFEINFGDYERKNGGIIFANPNAPTGRAVPLNVIERLLERHSDSVVVVDEAYVGFGGESAVDLIDAHDNLLVVQTLSKSHALAGLRVGFAFGHESLIEALERVKNSFNSYPLDRLAIAGSVAAIEDEAYFATTRGKVIATRDRLVTELKELDFQVLPSQANFLFVAHARRGGAVLARALRDRSIVVRHFGHERTANFLRITVGTDAQIDALIRALKEILA